jgi:hypothetical protein
MVVNQAFEHLSAKPTEPHFVGGGYAKTKCPKACDSTHRHDERRRLRNRADANDEVWCRATEFQADSDQRRDQ